MQLMTPFGEKKKWPYRPHEINEIWSMGGRRCRAGGGGRGPRIQAAHWAFQRRGWWAPAGHLKARTRAHPSHPPHPIRRMDPTHCPKREAQRGPVLNDPPLLNDGRRRHVGHRPSEGAAAAGGGGRGWPPGGPGSSHAPCPTRAPAPPPRHPSPLAGGHCCHDPPALPPTAREAGGGPMWAGLRVFGVIIGRWFLSKTLT